MRWSKANPLHGLPSLCLACLLATAALTEGNSMRSVRTAATSIPAFDDIAPAKEGDAKSKEHSTRGRLPSFEELRAKRTRPDPVSEAADLFREQPADANKSESQKRFDAWQAENERLKEEGQLKSFVPDPPQGFVIERDGSCAWWLLLILLVVAVVGGIALARLLILTGSRLASWLRADPYDGWCNRRQKAILWIAAAVMCAILAFPPLSQRFGRIDRDKLSIRIGAVVTLAAVAFVTTGTKRKRVEGDK